MGKTNTQKTILTILAIFIFGLRFFSGYKQYAGDVNNHIGWAQSINSQGYMGFYSRVIPDLSVPNYPPLAMYSFSVSERLYDITEYLFKQLNANLGAFPSKAVWWIEQKNTLAMFMKIPAIVGDALLAIGVYLVARDIYKSKRATLWALAILINPALYYVSAVWGQIESLVMAFVILSGYFGLKRRTVASVLFFAMAALTKQTALWMTPIFLMLWSRDLWGFVRGALSAFVLTLVAYIPFFGFNFEFVNSYLGTLSGSSSVSSDKAYNLWYFLTGMVPDSNRIGLLTIRQWSVTALIICIVCVMLWYRRSNTKESFWTGLWALSLGAFFLQTRVHERHLYPAVVLQLLLKNKTAMMGYILLSIYFMVNLYWSLGLSFI